MKNDELGMVSERAMSDGRRSRSRVRIVAHVSQGKLGIMQLKEVEPGLRIGFSQRTSDQPVRRPGSTMRCGSF